MDFALSNCGDIVKKNVQEDKIKEISKLNGIWKDQSLTHLKAVQTNYDIIHQ